MPALPDSDQAFDTKLRQFIYKHFIERGNAPTTRKMAAAMRCSLNKVKAGFDRLCQSHAFVLQESGELWRAAPFSAVPTAFPVQVGRRQYWGNCIWDALGIPAMLHQDGVISASCGCCNLAMTVTVKKGKLGGAQGTIHIAVPARHWYEDIVFT